MNTRNYIIKMEFLEHAVYKGHVNTTPSKILFYIEHNFVKRLTEALRKKIRQSSAAKSISVAKERPINYFKHDSNNADEDSLPPIPDEPMKADDGDSTEESEGEGDTTSAKSKKRHDQDQEYEDPEEEEILPESSEESENEEVTIKEEIKSDNEESTSPEFLESNEDVKPTIDKASRINYVKTWHSWISNYNFDAKREHWCEISLQLPLDNNKIDMKSLLEEEINKANIHSVPNINDAILVENPNAKEGCNLMLKTDGVNFLEIFKYVNVLDINKVYSNNIHEISKIYGIEAAAQAIRKEIVNVFAAYGIQVDPRHLSLVSDYMTCSGQYRPCNRIGMEGNASPLQQITFETSKNFLAEAMVMGVQDRMTSPSANIIVGQLPPAGTGCFNLLGARS
ncbi:unnamed protein product [Larinioides sclopetarius]|uniref:DNA-directed RNA polymerase n=1 Tax=Larinioides sclopetarius TaxID=280406 RepID=A0AAV2BX21_9ARAC